MFKIISAFAKVSKLSNISPIEKLILSLLPIIILGFSNNAMPLILNILVFAILHYISRNPRKIVIKFTLFAVVFASISSITFVVDYGVRYCSIILLKTLSGGMCLSFLALTTPIDDILYFLSKYDSLRDICDIVKNMERFLVLIEDEYNIINKAMDSKCGFERLSHRIKNTGKLAGLLFKNTMKRWHDIKDGINSRCYRGYMPFMDKKFNFSVMRKSSICLYNIILLLLLFY